jgi:hypothetical protein
MKMHPELTTVVYVVLVIVALSVITYWFLYTRGLHAKQAALNKMGRLPASREEGIAIATLDKEHAHRTGTIT